MGNLARDVLFACRAQDYTFCLLIVRYMLSDKIKGKSALKARTFLHERDKVRVCYWFRLSMHLSTENSAGQIFLKPFIGEMFIYKKHSIHRNSSAMVINMVTDIKQTCLGQGLGVTFTARKRPSKLMFTMKDLSHTLPDRKIEHLQVTDVTTLKKAMQTTALNN